MSRRPPRVANALADWIPLVDASGPFLTLPVLKRAFPNGFDRVSSEVRAEMRQRLEALDAAGTGDARQLRPGAASDARAAASRAQRAEWLRWILRDLLEYRDLLREGSAVPDSLQHTVSEQRVTLRPDFVLVGPPETGAPDGLARLLVEAYPFGTDFTKRLPDQRWTATPVERMAILCRATGVELGLVTDTNAFTLVWAPRGGSVATATWCAGLWSEERGLFDAFVALLGARRFFAVAADDTLEALFAQSATAQVEVTDQLGKQVRQAVELLVDAFSRANRESGGQLLDDLGAGDDETAAEMVYAAAVTVMMRLVFMLCAEERRLFPVGDALYDGSYAISTMLDGLREEASLHGEETLERRTAAWHRLLATFRLVHDGVQHETLRVPAYGGSLFDPERFPFLEGRRPGKAGAGTPPAVSDRSVLAILDALQFLSFKGETRRVSYHALDVEQIGHVYEGLLDHGCTLVDGIVLGLGGKSEPEVPLAELEAAARKGRESLVTLVQERTGRNGAASIVRDLDRPLDAEARRYLIEACENDMTIVRRVTPFVHLLRRDLRALPVVFLPGAVCVTQTSSRRDSGTEYTTRDLADEVVRHTLQPLVYAPGPQDGVTADGWKLRTSAEILALRVCDPAVGSGAILVAACRYLAARLAEAWTTEDSAPEDAVGDPDALTIAARRAVVDHCLFGVDRNPMAAEMAKLSLWLVTMAKDRPFSFLDHAVQSGDSLLGLTSMEQLTSFHIDPVRGHEMNPDLFGHRAAVEMVAQQAVEKYRAMAGIKVVTVRDAEEKARLHGEATDLLRGLRALADSVAGAALRAAGEGATAVDAQLARLAELAGPALAAGVATPDSPATRRLLSEAKTLLSTDPGRDGKERLPLHWPLVFPEVFLGRDGRRGFDGILGNPPFLGGKRITAPLGTVYRNYLVQVVADGRTGSADLVTYFFLLSAKILTAGGVVGLLATETVAEGDSREVGLDWLIESGWRIVRAVKSAVWPGSANVRIAKVWLTKRPWEGAAVLDDVTVDRITPSLTIASRVSGNPFVLKAGGKRCFIGSVVNGKGFTLTPEKAKALLDSDPRNADVLSPYLGGEDVTSRPDHSPSRWVINFSDWDLERAETYTDCMKIVRTLVKPFRDDLNRKAYRDRWWQFAERQAALYEAASGMSHVIVVTLVSKTALPVVVPNTSVFSHKLAVFALSDMFHLGVLSSALHWWWASQWSGSRGGVRINYSPTDCFETFPMPEPDASVRGAAQLLHDMRSRILMAEGIGLTDLYNRVHDEAASDQAALAVRDAHRRLDEAVCRAYGWGDVALEHDVYETSRGPRFAPSVGARTVLLDRLLELNHARYAEEVRLGLHERAGRRTGGKSTGRAKVTATGGSQLELAPAAPELETR